MGFRKNHSTSLALIDVIDNIYSCLDNNETVVGIYIDLQKAFDTVDHNILLYKLYTVSPKIAIFTTFLFPLGTPLGQSR